MTQLKKRKTREELERRITDLEAQLAHRYKSAHGELEKSGEMLTASAAVLSITALGGRSIVNPVAIIDGLSAESIKALQNDLTRSFNIVMGKKGLTL